MLKRVLLVLIVSLAFAALNSVVDVKAATYSKLTWPTRTPRPTVRPRPTRTPYPTPSPTAYPTPVPTPTPTPFPTRTPYPTPTPTPTPIPTPTALPTPSPSAHPVITSVARLDCSVGSSCYSYITTIDVQGIGFAYNSRVYLKQSSSSNPEILGTTVSRIGSTRIITDFINLPHCTLYDVRVSGLTGTVTKPAAVSSICP